MIYFCRYCYFFHLTCVFILGSRAVHRYHASNSLPCWTFYQRLEFLGDSVLDLLITWHLFTTHENLDPGELTDLRSASVKNENFALSVVRHNLQQHVLHSSGFLLAQITEYVNGLHEMHGRGDSLFSKISIKGPKVIPCDCLSLVSTYTCIHCMISFLLSE